MLRTSHFSVEDPCRRSQHFWPTRLNIVGPNLLRAFAYHVVCCCVLLRLVGSCWMMFETGQTSEPTSANISIVSPSSKRGPTMLRSFPQHFQQYCARARHQRVVISLWRVHFAQLNTDWRKWTYFALLSDFFLSSNDCVFSWTAKGVIHILHVLCSANDVGCFQILISTD